MSCGFYLSKTRKCTCTKAMLQKYARRLSGPLLDHIDLHINVDPAAYADLSSNVKTSSREIIRNRVIKQGPSVEADRWRYNAQMAPEKTIINCSLGTLEQELLIQDMEKQSFPPVLTPGS
ncbi:ATP-binding protein [Mucilaginibacter phyllosphaerae]